MASYYPNPYENSDNTGIARLLEQQHKDLLEMDRARTLSRIQQELAETRYLVDKFSNRYHHCIGISCEECGMGADPVVEKPKQSRFSIFWQSVTVDPFWEFFKRPPIK